MRGCADKRAIFFHDLRCDKQLRRGYTMKVRSRGGVAHAAFPLRLARLVAGRVIS
jgi:hypothetical protein